MENTSEQEEEKILEYLNELKNSKILVVVEGIKDKNALAKFEVTNVMTLKKALFAVVDDIIELKIKECVLLTDLDPTGKKIYGTLKQDLSRHGIIVRDEFRNFLYRKTQLRQIEGIYNYLNNLHTKQHKQSAHSKI